MPAAYACAPQEPGPAVRRSLAKAYSLPPGSPLPCEAPATAASLLRGWARPCGLGISPQLGHGGNAGWRSGVYRKDEPWCRSGNPVRLPVAGARPAGAPCAASTRRVAGVSARTVARHAVPQGVGRWTGRMVKLGLVHPAADAQPPRPPRRYDPLVHPVAVTEHCVIGDQIRVPGAWCDMTGCAAKFADPAALGEADNRARALVAGWCADPVGQLVCPACQQSDGVAGPRRVAGRGSDDDGGPAPAAAAPGRCRGGSASVRLVITRWRSTIGPGRHRRAQWPDLLAALVNDLGGWDARQPFIVASPGNTTGPAHPGEL